MTLSAEEAGIINQLLHTNSHVLYSPMLPLADKVRKQRLKTGKHLLLKGESFLKYEKKTKKKTHDILEHKYLCSQDHLKRDLLFGGRIRPHASGHFFGSVMLRQRTQSLCIACVVYMRQPERCTRWLFTVAPPFTCRRHPLRLPPPGGRNTL